MLQCCVLNLPCKKVDSAELLPGMSSHNQAPVQRGVGWVLAEQAGGAGEVVMPEKDEALLAEGPGLFCELCNKSPKELWKS